MIHLFAASLASSGYQSTQLNEQLESTTETIHARDGESMHSHPTRPAIATITPSTSDTQVLAATATAIEKNNPIEVSAFLAKKSLSANHYRFLTPRMRSIWISLVLKQETAGVAEERRPFAHQDRKPLGGKSRGDIERVCWFSRYITNGQRI